MPTYVYKFIESGETIEVQQAFTDEPFTELTHPADGTVRAVKKVFTPVGVSFKGGGFYKTDSRPSTTPSTAATPASTDSSSTAATATPAVTTPAATTPAAAPTPAATTSSSSAD
jgi:predicted nucleic acid-binding Zn ribbon protein